MYRRSVGQRAIPMLLVGLMAMSTVGTMATVSNAAPPSILDTTYSADGITGYGNAGRLLTSGRAVAIDSNGKIVVVGAYDNGSGDTDSVVLRYNADGTPDTTFATNGAFAWGGSFNNSHDRANAVAIDASGNIVVVGTFDQGLGNTDIEVMRLDSTGKLDSNFGPAGKGEIVLQNPGADSGNAVAIQPDGKIIVVGTSANGSAWVVRLNDNGSYDTGFNTTGSASFTNCSGNAVTLDGNGNILIAGTKELGTGNGSSMMVLRLTPGGALDTTFGAGGEVLQGNNKGANGANAIAVDLNGKIVVVGTYDWTNDAIVSQRTQQKDLWVQRFNSNGTPDVGGFFVNGGTGGVTFGGTGNDTGNAVAIQPDGMIMIAGTYDNGNSSSSTWVMRLKSNGQPSTTFNNGQPDFTYAPTVNPFTGAGIALQGDKKIVVAGTGFVQPGSSNTSTAMTLRLFGDTIPLTVTTTAGNGIANSSPGTLAYSVNVGTEYYSPNTTVTLTPQPSAGYLFVSWGGDCTGQGTSPGNTSCTLTMDAAKNVTIQFDNPTLFLTQIGGGTGSVNSNPSGIACTGGTCISKFTTSLVTLTALAAWDSTFTGWSGTDAGLCNGSTDPCNLNLNKVINTVDATFTPNQNILLLNDQLQFINFFSRFNTIQLPGGATSAIVVAKAMNFLESIDYGKDGQTATIHLFGGRNAAFDTVIGDTTLNGYLKISNGRMNVSNLKIK